MNQIEIPGIDVWSGYGPIDWAAVEASGVRFAYVRATGYVGRNGRDERTREHLAGIAQTSIAPGVYHVWEPGQDPQRSADLAWEHSDGFGTRVCDATEHAAQNTYAVTRYGLASKRCLVLLDGALRELPTSAPYGLRVILSAGALVTSVASGKSLVVDGGALRESTAGEAVLVPP